MGTKAVGGANGKHGRVFVGSLELCVTEWNLTESAQEEDTTNSCSAGKREFEYGIREANGRLTMDLDLSQHPLDSPPGLVPGTKTGTVTLYEHSAAGGSPGGPRWIFTSIGITSIEVTVPAANKVTYVINWRSSGAYTNPAENAGSSV